MNNTALEAEYNNRQKVPDHGSILEGWRARSAAFRQSWHFAELDVAYGASARQVMDIFWPDRARDARLAMFIHGGYWQSLDKSWVSHLARGFVESGVAVAMPSYELCPQVSLATLAEQVRAAAAFLIERHGRDVYATGHSAGGHLAAMLMATDFSTFGVAGRIYGAAAISGLFDLAPLVQTSINGALGLDVVEAKRLSPVYLDKPAGRLLAFVGADEGAEYYATVNDNGADMGWFGGGGSGRQPFHRGG